MKSIKYITVRLETEQQQFSTLAIHDDEKDIYHVLTTTRDYNKLTINGIQYTKEVVKEEEIVESMIFKFY